MRNCCTRGVKSVAQHCCIGHAWFVPGLTNEEKKKKIRRVNSARQALSEGGIVGSAEDITEWLVFLLFIARRAFFFALVNLFVSAQVRDDGEMPPAAFNITCEC